MQVAAFGAGSVGVTLLYCAFNPGERMIWYYVLPQTLLVLGAVSSLLSVLHILPQKAVWFRLAICSALTLSLPFSAGAAKRSAEGIIAWIRQVEPERIAVGEFIHSAAAPSDRLLAEHGHIARYARLYTYDSSGLNSRLITQLRKEGKSPLRELRPEWIAQHGLLEGEEQAQLAYELVASFYNISLMGWPAWRVYRRSPHARESSSARGVMPASELVDGEQVGNRHDMLHLRGRSITLRIPETETAPDVLIFGVVKQEEPFALTVTVQNSTSSKPPRMLENILVPASNADDLVNDGTLACRIELPPGNRFASIRIGSAHTSSAQEPQPFLMLEPAWLSSPAQATERSDRHISRRENRHP